MKLPKSAIVDLYRKTCQQKLAADEALRNKEKAHEVTRRMLKSYSADLTQAKKTAVIMAMLASETPQFYNPFDVMEAKKLRALILAENSVFSDRRVDTFWDSGKINLRAHFGIIDFQ